jgi:hypothetical protein
MDRFWRNLAAEKRAFLTQLGRSYTAVLSQTVQYNLPRPDRSRKTSTDNFRGHAGPE